MRNLHIRNIIRNEVKKYLLAEQDQKQENNRPIVSWNPSEIVDNEVEFILEESPEDYEFVWEDNEEIMEIIAQKGYDNFAQNLKNAGLYDTAEELARYAVNDKDSDFLLSKWGDLKKYLTELIEERNPSGDWYAEGYNLGWRHRSGHKTFHATTGEEFLLGFLPDTDCDFYLYDIPNSKGFRVVNYHHDAPTGERYNIYPMREIVSDQFNNLTINDFKETSRGEMYLDLGDFGSLYFFRNGDSVYLEDEKETMLKALLAVIKNDPPELGDGNLGTFKIENVVYEWESYDN